MLNSIFTSIGFTLCKNNEECKLEYFQVIFFEITLEQLQGNEEIGEDCQSVNDPLLYKVHHHFSSPFIKFFHNTSFKVLLC